MVAESTPFYTPSEYVQLENAAEHKSEYINGQIYAMSGGSPAHSRIGGNVFAFLFNQLRGKPCEPFNSDTRVKILETRASFYPDVSVACPPLEYAPEDDYALTNPIVLVEIISPSTEKIDHISKWAHYQQVPSLRDYVLIAQDKIKIEHYARRDDGSWIYRVVDNSKGAIDLQSIGCRLLVSEIYERVEFPDAPVTLP